MPLLTIATFLPILAGLALMALPDRSTKKAHTVSIAATGAVFLITLGIWARGIVAGDFAQVEEIATAKMPDLSAANMEAAVRTIAGSARSMGITVEGL